MFNFFKRKKKKEESVVEEAHVGTISDWSYQRFCDFYGQRVFPDPKFMDKINTIIKCIKEDRMERLDEIAEHASCGVEEVIMKIRYLKNKRALDDLYIDRVNRLVRKCSEDDNKILNSYKDMIYKEHLSIDDMAAKVPNYYNKPLPIIEEDVYKDIKYLYDKCILNGIKLDESIKEIVYYTIEKKRKAENYSTVNCPKCGSLVDVLHGSSSICEYCGTTVRDNK